MATVRRRASMSPLRPIALFLTLALLALAAPASAEPTLPSTAGPTCHLLIVGPDILFYLCYNPRDLSCPVYTVRVGHEGETTTTCYP